MTKERNAVHGAILLDVIAVPLEEQTEALHHEVRREFSMPFVWDSSHLKFPDFMAAGPALTEAQRSPRSFPSIHRRADSIAVLAFWHAKME